MTAKLFGYLKFPSRLFEIDSAQTSRNEAHKEINSLLNNDPSLATNKEFMERNNTYAVIPPFPIFYHTRAQTSLLRSVFMCLQENNTKETFLECSFDHYNCKQTRIEHFIHDMYTLFNPIPKAKKKRNYEIPWLTESYVQRFYNNSMSFKEFGDSLLNIYDLKTKTSMEMVTLCWKTFNREIFFKLSENTLAGQLEEENLRKLFEIFTHLDNNMMCQITPFLINQYLTWWISESGVKINKEIQNLAEWHKNIPKNLFIDFPEFLKQIHRLFLSGVPYHIYKTLILDAWDSLVAGVIQKGVLEKVGPNKGRWLPRVMYLHIDRIDYFKKKSHGTVSSKGTIHLGPKSAVIEIFSEDKLGYFQLAVTCSETMRRYLLRSDDQRIRHIWVTKIQSVLDVMKGAIRPMALEKPLKFIEDPEGDIVKLRSVSTNVCGVNTLDGRQIIFNKRHSDDFTKHFKIHFPQAPLMRRASSFSKIPQFIADDDPRKSVVSKASTMSGCMDLTVSPHPSSAVDFFPANNCTDFELLPEGYITPSPDGSEESCLDYESMISTSSHNYVIQDVTHSLRLSKVPTGDSDEEILSTPPTRIVQKSRTIDDNLDLSGESRMLFSPQPNPREKQYSADTIPPVAPVPLPRKRVLASTSSYVSLPDTPPLPVRRKPQAPVRSSSRRKVYENCELLLNKL